MNIGGFQKTSLIDYPGKISCIVFLSGCNFHCPYCHNPELARPGAKREPVMDLNELIRFLARRVGLIDGVVITGGEPTLQADLPMLCREIRALGFSIKLDTNGSRPDILEGLITDQLVDFLAMDIKTDPDRYAPFISDTCKPAAIRAAIGLILSSQLPHEFRTTCVKPIIDEDAIHIIGELLAGAQSHALQRVQHENVDTLHPEFFRNHEWFIDDTTLKRYQSLLAEYVGACLIR